LGDASLCKTSSTTNSSFSTCHCEDQKEWLLWKHSTLLPFSTNWFSKKVRGRRRLKTGIVINDNSKHYIQYGFLTIRHPILTAMEQQWYKRDADGNYLLKPFGSRMARIKCLPPNFSLTPLALAVWFVDDGCNQVQRKSHSLYSMAFSEEEVDYLVEEIMRLGITDCYRAKNRSGPEIRIGRFSYLDFAELVKNQLPDLHASMSYKIDVSAYNSITNWSDNSLGIPFFYQDNGVYRGKLQIGGEYVHLGSYHDIEKAKVVSEEIQSLVKQRCKDVTRYVKIRIKHKTTKYPEKKWLHLIEP
jgi:hypothetical protein